ncbi:unnamed protein product [Ceratitis capitata]|uniref:(Mediterranean fruit fly) hypothetical protein n=1 Tax=Ceratitis capitata TaxID=7213 RepID=A0A811V685_CERCA|nr:unnamed protein product [Ceratitis capitata]
MALLMGRVASMFDLGTLETMQKATLPLDPVSTTLSLSLGLLRGTTSNSFYSHREQRNGGAPLTLRAWKCQVVNQVNQ